ncbi:type II toxin-antitoxin system RelE/ParE family toxin [Avibacterium sp. 20-126]|nr:type II toxin-antitoxin system RelE/ParE family toxin [Avibacterium sp. 20-126]
MFNLTAKHFKDDYLYRFFQYGELHSKIPAKFSKSISEKIRYDKCGRKFE